MGVDNSGGLQMARALGRIVVGGLSAGAAVLLTNAIPQLRTSASYLLPALAVALAGRFAGPAASIAAVIVSVPLTHVMVLRPATPRADALTVDLLATAVLLAMAAVTRSLAAAYQSVRQRALEERAGMTEAAQAAQAAAEHALAVRGDLEQRLKLLLRASEPLTGALHVDVALREILSVARQLIRADAYAVWRCRADGPHAGWFIATSDGLSEEYRREAIDDLQRNAGRTTLLERPIVVEDVRQFTPVSARRELYLREGIESFLAVPLRLHDRTESTIVFYYRQARRFSDIDVESAAALGNLAAAAIRNAELFEATDRLRSEAQTAEQRAAFLADASRVLSASLDYGHTIARIADLAVPALADWCVVDMLRDDGTIERLALVQDDPSRQQWASRLPAPSLADERGAGFVIRTGQVQTRLEVTPEILDAAAKTPEERERWREVGISSYVCVPLAVQGRTVGALTLTTGGGRRLGAADGALAEELARRVAQAIDNAWLYRAAQHANRAKDEFLATLSHELRTPINAILGWSRMLTTGTLEAPAAAHALEVIQRNARIQTQLIEDILDVSRIITGNVRIDVRPVHLAEVINAAVESLKPAADAKGVALDLLFEPESASVSGDAARLQQIVWNLVSNALRFTDRGGRVEVRLNQVDSRVDISVIDNGAGIRAELLPVIFERFRQGDSTSTRVHGGLGLGLAIVRHLAELHGGSVRAQSAGPGLGATFVVSLPVMAVAEGTWQAHEAEAGT